MVDIILIGLVLAAVAVSLLVGFLIGRALTAKAKELEVQGRVKEASEVSVKQSRSSITGRVIEQLAPFLPDFRYDPTEVQFIGSPIDCLVFRGASREECDEVVFLEIKSGKSGLTTVQRRVRDAVKEGRVRWDEYRASEYLPYGTGHRW